MKNELEVLNRNICVPGCTFSRTGLRFDVVEEGVLANVSACLQEMGKATDWWWGDYLVAWVEFKIEAEGATHEEDELKEKRRRFWVRNHASVLGGDALAQTQEARYELASFYNSACRQAELSKKHHEEAMNGAAGDLAIAQEWLEKAKTLGWSANQLRAEIRGATRKQAGATPTKQTVTQQWLFDARMGASAQMNRVDDMDADEAGFLLAQLAPVLALANALAAKFGPMHGVGVGGKESIASAARQR
jgi:hypothetical protein